MSAESQASVVARLTADTSVARSIFDQLGECFDETQAALSLEERSAGSWQVAIHFQQPPNEAAVRALVALVAGAQIANALTFETLAAKDWVAASLQGLAPVIAGRFVVHGAHDRPHVPKNLIAIEIEAALAFGTGHHGTTRGCLLALDGLLKTWKDRRNRSIRILDLGTGSGVLAIAAARALRAPVLASDIDRRAADIARENARHNRAHGGGSAAGVTVVHANGVNSRRLRERAPYDLVLANILLGPLQRLAAPLTRLLARRAGVVLSGLLVSHANAALAAYRLHGLALDRRIRVDGWVTLVLRRGPRRPGRGAAFLTTKHGRVSA